MTINWPNIIKSKLSQHHVEAEARLIQALPAEQVVALFEQHCAQRLSP